MQNCENKIHKNKIYQIEEWRDIYSLDVCGSSIFYISFCFQFGREDVQIFCFFNHLISSQKRGGIKWSRVLWRRRDTAFPTGLIFLLSLWNSISVLMIYLVPDVTGFPACFKSWLNITAVPAFAFRVKGWP